MTDTPAGDLQTWTKVHDSFLETALHQVRLRLDRHLLWMQSLTDSAHGAADTDPDHGAEVGAGHDLTDFFDRSPPARELTELIAAHHQQMADYEQELLALGGPSGLSAVAAAAGLSDVEQDVLLLALAVELDPSVARMCALIHDDPGRPYVTPSLISVVTNRPISNAWPLLDPASGLQRFRIVEPPGSTSGVTTRLALDTRMVNGLRGRNHLDTRLIAVTSPMHALPIAGPHDAVVDDIIEWIRRQAEEFSGGIINLVGRRGQGRESIVVELGRQLAMLPLEVQIAPLAEQADRLDALRLIEREALLMPALTYLDTPDGSGDDRAIAASFGLALDNLAGVVVVGSTQPINHRLVALSITVPALQPVDGVALWEQVLGGNVDAVPAPEELLSLAHQFALGPAAVQQAAISATSRHDDTPVTATDLWQASRRFVGRELGELAHRIEPRASWDQLVLPDRELALLEQICDQVENRATVYDEWGFGSRSSTGLGISALFAGPPGTGKTMAAELMADRLQLDLYRIDLSSVISKYIGETEKNLRRVFDAADQGGAILFFDEADALFGKRTEVKDSHDRHANVEINYLLQRMEEYCGLSILATNRKADLDAAFLRRIRFLVSFPFPRRDYRRRIWQAMVPPQVPVASLDFDILAKLEIAGGSIRNVAVNGAFSAAADNSPLTMEHLMVAAAHEYRKMDKMVSAGEFDGYYELVKP